MPLFYTESHAAQLILVTGLLRHSNYVASATLHNARATPPFLCRSDYVALTTPSMVKHALGGSSLRRLAGCTPTDVMTSCVTVQPHAHFMCMSPRQILTSLAATHHEDSATRIGCLFRSRCGFASADITMATQDAGTDRDD